jgi:hypothetical protein
MNYLFQTTILITANEIRVQLKILLAKIANLYLNGNDFNCHLYRAESPTLQFIVNTSKHPIHSMPSTHALNHPITRGAGWNQQLVIFYAHIK